MDRNIIYLLERFNKDGSPASYPYHGQFCTRLDEAELLRTHLMTRIMPGYDWLIVKFVRETNG